MAIEGCPSAPCWPASVTSSTARRAASIASCAWVAWDPSGLTCDSETVLAWASRAACSRLSSSAPAVVAFKVPPNCGLSTSSRRLGCWIAGGCESSCEGLLGDNTGASGCGAAAGAGAGATLSWLGGSDSSFEGSSCGAGTVLFGFCSAGAAAGLP